MKSFLRPILVPFAFGLVLVSPLLGAGMNIERTVDRLAQLVSLTSQQKNQAAEIFAHENAALQEFPSIQERMEKGMPIRQKSRADIRALLTPAQQQIYDRTPQRLGGGSMQDPAAIISRVDKVVSLTDEQTQQVAALYLKQADALQALSPEQRASGQGGAISRATKAQVRALLTPEQQAKFDANPNGAEDLDIRADVVAFIKSAPAISLRLGLVSTVSPLGGSISTSLFNDQPASMRGTYSYRVKGGVKTATLKISWEKTSPSAAVKILKIEEENGPAIEF